MALNKSAGTTDTERLLARLCHDTFLGFWSYPNVFRNQGPQGCNHELVDLLVVCEQDVILFSDKLCNFPTSDELVTNWARWYKRAVEKSAQQLFGAERWIKQHPDRIFLDPACAHRFPLKIPQIDNCRFHRIVVASGAKDACRQHLSGSGSFILAPQIKGSQHTDKNHKPLPFFVGNVAPERGWVHVVDDVSLPLLLTELDTITDFLSYLSAKEKLFLTPGLTAIVAGEENLLATYLANEDADFASLAGDLLENDLNLMVADGIWEEYSSSGQRANRKMMSNNSRVIWDNQIIQEFATHAFHGTLISGSPTTVQDNEILFRLLATESRVARVFLTECFIERCFCSPLDRVAFRSVASPTHPQTIYAFVFYPCRKKGDMTNRASRRDILRDYVLTVAYRNREFKRIVGVATELGDFPYRTFDVTLLETEAWTQELECLASQKLARLKLFKEDPMCIGLPRPNFIEFDQARRNDLCPCGSGKKFKRCCLRRVRGT